MFNWKYFGKAHKLLYRLSGGRYGSKMGWIKVALVDTVGRKSGLPREIPLSYTRTSAGVAVLAGFGRSTGWAHNLRARPRADVLVGDTRYAATAVEVTDPLQALRATRAVMCDAGAAGFFYGWDPRRASDEQVRRVVAETCCFHLRFDELPPWAA